MQEKYTYLLVDFFCILFPFIFSFYPKIKFYRQWRFFVAPCLLTGLFFVVWDVWFTKAGIWSFNPRYLVGVYLLGLPLEEYLFFLCIPYACVFTYYCVDRFFSFLRLRKITERLSFLLIGFLIIVASLHLYQLYTSVTFLLLSFLLIFLLSKKVVFLPTFYVSFFIILLPFFISNGILTGSFTAEPVVSYNNNYNLGIRMFTIPFEDTFYGMILLLMNVAGFEYLKAKKAV